MFCTKNLVSDYREVDVRWIFEFYLNLPEKLEGQDVKIKSVFNKGERTPSMVIGIPKDKEEYKFKCFSTGISGSAVDLVKNLKGLTFPQAANQIIEDYNEYVLKNGCGYSIQNFKKQSRYQVTDYTIRKWTTKDQYYWSQYNISSRILSFFNVKPLESYKMSKEDAGEIEIKGLHIYGYFDRDQILHKIYQPKVADRKFIKIHSHTQGEDQLTWGTNPTLIIVSGLKDIMSLHSLNLNCDYVAGDSETSILSPKKIEEYKSHYKHILTLMDDDAAGRKCSQNYKEAYGIEPVYIVTEGVIKDPAEMVKQWGPQKTIEYLVPKIDKLINL